MAKTHISIKCSWADSKKYKALSMPFWLMTIPLLIPLQLLTYIGEWAEFAGFFIFKLRVSVVNNIALWLKWDGIKKYEHKDKEDGE